MIIPLLMLPDSHTPRSWFAKISTLFNTFCSNSAPTGDWLYSLALCLQFCISTNQIPASLYFRIVNSSNSSNDAFIAYFTNYLWQYDTPIQITSPLIYFSTIPFAPPILLSYFAPRSTQIVYAMVNPKFRKLYIGRTNDCCRRFREHRNLGRSNDSIKIGEDSTNFHRFMANHSPSQWLMIPILNCGTCEMNCIYYERKFIQSFKGLSLNFMENPWRITTKSRSLRCHRKRPPLPHRARSRRIAISPQSIYIPQTFTATLPHCGNITVSSHNLAQLISSFTPSTVSPTFKPISLSVSGNWSTLTDWNQLRARYGRSICELHGQFLTLSRALPLLKSNSITNHPFTIVTVVDNRSKYYRSLLTRLAITKKPKAVARLAVKKV